MRNYFKDKNYIAYLNKNIRIKYLIFISFAFFLIACCILANFNPFTSHFGYSDLGMANSPNHDLYNIILIILGILLFILSIKFIILEKNWVMIISFFVLMFSALMLIFTGLFPKGTPITVFDKPIHYLFGLSFFVSMAISILISSFKVIKENFKISLIGFFIFSTSIAIIPIAYIKLALVETICIILFSVWILFIMPKVCKYN